LSTVAGSLIFLSHTFRKKDLSVFFLDYLQG